MISRPITFNLEPSAIRHDFDGYGYNYIDGGYGSNWKIMGEIDAEFLYTKEDIIDWLSSVRAIFKSAADDHELDGNLNEETYNRNVAYGLNEIIKDLEA